MKKRRTIKANGPDPIDRFVGSRVRARRMGMRLSQTKLGEAIGVTFQQVQKYENGMNRIGASNLYRIARTLGVEVSYFFDGMPQFESVARGGALSDRSQLNFEADPLTSREAIELTHNFFRVRDAMVRKRLSQFVKTLAQSLDS